VATEIEGVDPDKLHPRRLFERDGRLDEYDEMVAALKAARAEYLDRFEDLLDPRVAKAAD